MEIDTSELRRLAVDLGKVPAAVIPEAEAVLKKGAQNLKTEMQAAFQESPHFKAVARAVSYDRVGGAREVGYEIGPTVGGAGSLAHIAVDGGANGGGASVDIDSLLPREAAAVEKYLGDILGDAL